MILSRYPVGVEPDHKGWIPQIGCKHVGVLELSFREEFLVLAQLSGTYQFPFILPGGREEGEWKDWPFSLPLVLPSPPFTLRAAWNQAMKAPAKVGGAPTFASELNQTFEMSEVICKGGGGCPHVCKCLRGLISEQSFSKWWQLGSARWRVCFLTHPPYPSLPGQLLAPRPLWWGPAVALPPCPWARFRALIAADQAHPDWAREMGDRINPFLGRCCYLPCTPSILFELESWRLNCVRVIYFGLVFCTVVLHGDRDL